MPIHLYQVVKVRYGNSLSLRLYKKVQRKQCTLHHCLQKRKQPNNNPHHRKHKDVLPLRSTSYYFISTTSHNASCKLQTLSKVSGDPALYITFAKQIVAKNCTAISGDPALYYTSPYTLRYRRNHPTHSVQQQHSRVVYTYFTRKSVYCQAILFAVAVPACVLFA